MSNVGEYTVRPTDFVGGICCLLTHGDMGHFQTAGDVFVVFPETDEPINRGINTAAGPTRGANGATGRRD